MRFDNSIIVITGGASGIGAETARLYAKKGGKVYVLDINTPATKLDNISYLSCDVSNFASLNAAMQTVVNTEGRIDILFVNAGIHLFANIEESSLDEIDSVINVNLKGTLYALKAALPEMKKNKSGKIVLMGSDQSFVGKKDSCVYGATKAAIMQLTKSVALDYAEYNIRVNCICPGTIETPLVDGAINRLFKLKGTAPEATMEALRTGQPIQRIGKPEEIARAVLFMTSDHASYMTGSSLVVDGGYTAR